MGVGMPAPPSALEIARALIRFPSVTPADCGALPYLRDLLGKAGFATELVTFEAPGTPAVLNLYARFGVGSPNLAFAGHTDVVPPGDKAVWRFDPFSGEIADGELWGRGACDMKGGVAASVAAALRFIAKGRVRRLDQLPHHRRRRRPGDQRHGQARRLGARQGGDLRPLHPGRIDLCRDGRRHHQARAARLAQRTDRDPRPPGPRGLPAYRRQSDSGACADIDGAALAAARFRKRRLRAHEPRSGLGRRRQSGLQRHSGRSAPQVQRPLQRPVDARFSRRRNHAPRGGAPTWPSARR